jgi:hypothetical protein
MLFFETFFKTFSKQQITNCLNKPAAKLSRINGKKHIEIISYIKMFCTFGAVKKPAYSTSY